MRLNDALATSSRSCVRLERGGSKVRFLSEVSFLKRVPLLACPAVLVAKPQIFPTRHRLLGEASYDACGRCVCHIPLPLITFFGSMGIVGTYGNDACTNDH